MGSADNAVADNGALGFLEEDSGSIPDHALVVDVEGVGENATVEILPGHGRLDEHPG